MFLMQWNYSVLLIETVYGKPILIQYSGYRYYYMWLCINLKHLPSTSCLAAHLLFYLQIHPIHEEWFRRNDSIWLTEQPINAMKNDFCPPKRTRLGVQLKSSAAQSSSLLCLWPNGISSIAMQWQSFGDVISLCANRFSWFTIGRLHC